MIAENVFLGRGEMIATRRLERLDLFLGHVDQEGKVGGISPQAN